MWIPGNLDESSFGGVVGKGAQVENVRGRIIGGEEIIVTVDNYLFAMFCCSKKQGNGTIPGGRCLVNGGVFKMVGHSGTCTPADEDAGED